MQRWVHSPWHVQYKRNMYKCSMTALLIHLSKMASGRLIVLLTDPFARWVRLTFSDRGRMLPNLSAPKPACAFLIHAMFLNGLWHFTFDLITCRAVVCLFVFSSQISANCTNLSGQFYGVLVTINTQQACWLWRKMEVWAEFDTVIIQCGFRTLKTFKSPKLLIGNLVGFWVFFYYGSLNVRLISFQPLIRERVRSLALEASMS